VHDIALWVDDARDAYAKAIERGAKSAYEPRVRATTTAGRHRRHHDLWRHDSFAGRAPELSRAFMPGFEKRAPRYQAEPTGLLYVDHCVGNVELGKMNAWVGFYERVMGFKNLISFDDKDISTEYSSLMSKVMSNGNERIKFPINEPAEGKKKSQIDEYLEFYRGRGAAPRLATNDIIHTVTRSAIAAWSSSPCRRRTTMSCRPRRPDRRAGRQAPGAGNPVDRDPDGYLLQIFSKAVEDRPTLFYEIIERKGARSFGKGNFKALFEAIEREQAARGNL
jgi:4-hydroxyphenylpyruvate dioxygenase